MPAHQSKDTKTGAESPCILEALGMDCLPIKSGLLGQKKKKNQLPVRKAPPGSAWTVTATPNPSAPAHLTSTSCPATPARQTPRAAPPSPQRSPAPRRGPAIFARSALLRRRSQVGGAEGRRPGCLSRVTAPWAAGARHWRSGRRQAASEHHLFIVGVRFLGSPPLHHSGWRARPPPEITLQTPHSPNPTKTDIGREWVGGGTGWGQVLGQQVSPFPSPLGPQFIHLGQREGLESADLGGPSHSDVLNLKTRTGPRWGGGWMAWQAGCYGDRRSGMSWAFWAGFLPRGSSGHPGHQSKGEGEGKRDYMVRAASGGCDRRFLKEPASVAPQDRVSSP